MRPLVVLLLAVCSVSASVAVGSGPVLAGPPAGVEKWAVVVGVDHFKGRTRPNVGAVGDANAFTQALTRAGWPADHILTLTDQAATASGIRSAMQWLSDRSSDTSYSVMHYSGHTKQLSGDRDRDGEALDEYLWPHDNKFISDAEFSSAMRAVKGWVWVDFSGCEGGGLDDGISDGRHLVTAASQESEKAFEYPPWSKSVFTGLLVDQAILQGLGDANGDGRVSVTEAFRYAEQRAPEVTAGQTPSPQHPYMAGGDGSEWFLDGPPPPPPPPPGTAPGQRTVCIGSICLPKLL